MEFVDKQKKDRVTIYLFYLICLLGFCMLFAPDYEVDSMYTTNYWIDALYLFICSFLFGWGLFTRKFDLFSPITIFSLIYLMMFFVTPMYDIYEKEIIWFGNDLFSYGIKASSVAFAGYVSFYLFYSVKFEFRKLHNIGDKYYVSSLEGKWFLPTIVIGYMVCLMANFYYLISFSGNSILYILTLGMAGSSGLNGSSENIGAISMFSYSLPSFTLLYAEYGKSKVAKVILFILMFVLQVARGFRFFIIQIVVMFGAYYFLMSKRKPRFKDFIILSVCLLVPVLLMTMFRNGIRSGQGMNLSSINSEKLVDAFDAAFWENFRIYKTYYGIIKAVPQMTDYLYGKQMIIYTAIMFIPRAIWHEKPGNPGTEAQLLALGEAAVVGGSAYPCLGEFYYECGIIGVVFWMAILGNWLSNVQQRYRYSAKTPIDFMVYSTILGLILQLIIRGYTPSNFWMIVFCMLPYWVIIKFFELKK